MSSYHSAYIDTDSLLSVYLCDHSGVGIMECCSLTRGNVCCFQMTYTHILYTCTNTNWINWALSDLKLGNTLRRTIWSRIDVVPSARCSHSHRSSSTVKIMENGAIDAKDKPKLHHHKHHQQKQRMKPRWLFSFLCFVVSWMLWWREAKKEI